MRFFEKLGEFLYGNFSSDYAAEAELHKEVEAAQQNALDASYKRGNVSWLEYLGLSREIKSVGNMTTESRKKDASLSNLASGVPWWFWLGLAAGTFWYLGGFVWVKGILARKK